MFPPPSFFPKTVKLVNKWPNEIDTGNFRNGVRRGTKNCAGGRECMDSTWVLCSLFNSLNPISELQVAQCCDLPNYF